MAMAVRVGLCIALSCIVLVSATYSPSVPAFFWSGQSYFVGSGEVASQSHATANEVMHGDDVVALITRLTADTESSFAGSQYVKSSGAVPEVVLAFINEQLSSAKGSQQSGAYSLQARPSAIKAALGASVSSLSAPFVALGSARASEVIAKAFTTSTVLTLALDSDSSCASVVSAATARASLFTNGVADLILVKSKDAAATEACLSAVTSAVDAASSGRYLAVLSSESAGVVSSFTSFSSRASSSFSTSSLSLIDASAAAAHDNVFLSTSDDTTATSYNYTFSGPLYISSNIIIGLLTVAFLLTTLFIGLTCTMAIQAPLRFATPTQKLVIGKEH